MHSGSRPGPRRSLSGCSPTSVWTLRFPRPHGRAGGRERPRGRASVVRPRRACARRGAGGVKPDDARTVYDGKLIDVTLERWGDNEREIVEHPGSVAIVAVDGDSRVWLVRQLREAARKKLVELPAGARDEGEDPLDAAKRELREECGLTGGTGGSSRRSGRRPASAASTCISTSLKGSRRATQIPTRMRRSRSCTGTSTSSRRSSARWRTRKLSPGCCSTPPPFRPLESARLAHRRRQGDQDRRVPRRADACGRARARAEGARRALETARRRRQLLPGRRVRTRRRAGPSRSTTSGPRPSCCSR